MEYQIQDTIPNIEDKISVEVCTHFEIFKLNFERNEKVEKIKQILKKKHNRKAFLSNDIKIEFEISPKPTINQTIGDWSKDLLNPSIKTKIKHLATQIHLK